MRIRSWWTRWHLTLVFSFSCDWGAQPGVILPFVGRRMGMQARVACSLLAQEHCQCFVQLPATCTHAMLTLSNLLSNLGAQIYEHSHCWHGAAATDAKPEEHSQLASLAPGSRLLVAASGQLWLHSTATGR